MLIDANEMILLIKKENIKRYYFFIIIFTNLFSLILVSKNKNSEIKTHVKVVK